MTLRRKAFQLIVWIGILLNWAFAAMAFADPQQLIATLDLGAIDSTVWLFNYSVLLTLLSCFYIPAAANPVRYSVSAWLLIAARLVPATTFFIGVSTGFLANGFMKLGMADALIGSAELVLLVLLLRDARLQPTREAVSG